ncbi:hypothetical protein NL676_014873 [Syzygium grande]|nr:hypothetical protein NL676_014873 [Syzygium grande]
MGLGGAPTRLYEDPSAHAAKQCRALDYGAHRGEAKGTYRQMSYARFMQVLAGEQTDLQLICKLKTSRSLQISLPTAHSGFHVGHSQSPACPIQDYTYQSCSCRLSSNFASESEGKERWFL